VRDRHSPFTVSVHDPARAVYWANRRVDQANHTIRLLRRELDARTENDLVGHYHDIIADLVTDLDATRRRAADAERDLALERDRVVVAGDEPGTPPPREVLRAENERLYEYARRCRAEMRRLSALVAAAWW
jgi:hypothetical protein